jgi:hypothetical protein
VSFSSWLCLDPCGSVLAQDSWLFFFSSEYSRPALCCKFSILGDIAPQRICFGGVPFLALARHCAATRICARDLVARRHNLASSRTTDVSTRPFTGSTGYTTTVPIALLEPAPAPVFVTTPRLVLLTRLLRQNPRIRPNPAPTSQTCIFISSSCLGPHLGSSVWLSCPRALWRKRASLDQTENTRLRLSAAGLPCSSFPAKKPQSTPITLQPHLDRQTAVHVASHALRKTA